jgi:hypothetical protein
MQQNAIFRMLMIVALTTFAMLTAFQMFSMQGNVLGNSFRFLTPLAILVGLATPRLPFYLLLVAGAYLDLIKRFMILDSRFSDMDLAFLLGFAPALVAGMVLKFLFLAIFRANQITGREVKLFFFTTVLCCFLGGAQMLMGDGLRSAGNAVNMVAYLYMPLLVPRIFKSIPELKRLLATTAIIYLPAALWAIHQAYFGLEAFERDYLLSGMTNEVRQLDEVVFRNMGTMVSAHALSMVASILAVAMMIPVIWKNGAISVKAWFNPVRLLFIGLFLTGAYFTFSRTGWACAGIAVIAFVILQNRFLTYTAYFATLIGITALYLSADQLLKSRITQETQEILFQKFGASAEARQTLVLGTLDARLESMASFVNDSRIWTPFGLKLAKKDVQINWVHDILTENLIRLGYVPLGILFVGVLTSTLLCFRALFRMPLGPHRTMATYFAALALGMMSGAFSQGIMILYFPINFFWCLFLGASYALFLIQKQIAKLAVEETLSSPGLPATTKRLGNRQVRGSQATV